MDIRPRRASRFIPGVLLAFSGVWGACPDPVVPGGDWTDDRGEVVIATEGGILREGDTWYLWGMDRSADNHTYRGLNLYRSDDLVHWKHVRQILSSTSDPALGGGAVVERAKILRSPRTGKYVIWMHYEGHDAYNVAEVAWATSDRIDGDFKFQGHFRPMDLDSRDLNVYQDDDGKAYLICTTRGNQNVSLFELDSAYTGIVREVYRGSASNDMECEGHAIVKSEGKYHWMMSWCTGWDFNDNRYFTATSLAGPWSAGKGLAVAGTHTYESQVGWAFALRDPARRNFVYMGDRWSVHDFSLSRLVMLPFSVANGAFTVDWADRWFPLADTGWVRGEPWFPSGVYSLRSRATGKVLAASSSASGAAVAIQTDQGQPLQRWKLESLGNSEYRFSNLASGLRMDVSGESRDTGAKVIQYAASEKFNQKWHLVSTDGRWWRLIAANTLGKVLHVSKAATPDGSPVGIGAFRWKGHQEWEIVPEVPLRDGQEILMAARHSGLVLASGAQGATQQAVARTPERVWRARSLGSGWWAFEQAGRRLGVVGDGLRDGTALALTSDTGAVSRWRVVDDGKGWFQIVNGCSGRTLDVDGGEKGTAPGAAVQIWRWWGTSNQQWRFLRSDSLPVVSVSLPEIESRRGFSVHGRLLRWDPGVVPEGTLAALAPSGRILSQMPAARGASLLDGLPAGVVLVRWESSQGSREVLSVLP